jgi:putative transposase
MPQELQHSQHSQHSQDLQELKYTYPTRTYKQRITKKHPLYKTFKDLTFKSKNLYNLAIYTERQFYFQNNKIIPRFTLSTHLNNTEAFKSLPAKTSQHIIAQAYHSFSGFFKETKSFNKNPQKFTGRPKLPKYKSKKGHNLIIFDYQQLKITEVNTNKFIRLPNNLGLLRLPNYISTIRVKPKREDFTLDLPEKELIQLRITPNHNEFTVEYVYTQKILIPDTSNLKYTASIDLGLDNFLAITFFKPSTAPILINGKGLKSYNLYFNKRLSVLKSQAQRFNNQYTSNKIKTLYQKRNRFFNTWMHKASRFIVNTCLQNQVKTLVIGHNYFQKQQINLGHKNNQSFVQIPYTTFIHQLEYKLSEVGITLIQTEESYTSITSFLDNEQPTKENANKKRRITRGQFQSNTGAIINSDINASYQIMKKAFPKVYAHPDLIYNPIKVNIA